MLTQELLQQIFHDMWVHKLRSLLALFGIVWGTVAVVVLLALGQGFYERQMHRLASLASGTIEVYLGLTSKPYQGLPVGREIPLKANDIVELPKQLAEIEYASPHLTKLVTASHESQQAQAQVGGVSPSYAIIRKWQVKGRFFNEFDLKERRRVVFLGAKLSSSLFKGKTALEQEVLINGIPFTIIGIRSSENGADSWEDYNLFIPYTTFIALWGEQNIDHFLVTSREATQQEAVRSTLNHYFAKRYQYALEDKNVLHFIDYSGFRSFYVWFFRAIQGFLGLCGAFTLAVGGIGIANTLFLIVQERTQEIGLRKALGAQNYHILAQILLETMVLVGSGGVLGMTLALLLIKILTLLNLPDWLGTPNVSWVIVFATGFILLGIGMLAGYFPARRAAKMQPVQALATPPC